MKKTKMPGYIPWLYRNMKRRIPLILLLMAASVLGSLAAVRFSLGTRNVINGAVSGELQALTDACILQALIMCAMVALRLGSSYLSSLTMAHLSRDFKRNILKKILRCEYSEISKYHSGDLIQRMNSDAATAYGGVVGIATGLVGTVATFASSVAALLSIAPGFTLMLGCAACVVGVGAMALKRRLKALHKDVSAAGGRVSGFLHESISRLMMVQALDVAREMLRRADDVLDQSWNIQRRQRNLGFVTGLGSSVLIYASSFATLVWCGYSLYRGSLTYGDVSALLALVSSARSSMMAVPKMIPQIIAISASCERIMEIEELPDQPEPDRGDRAECYASMTAICARGLSFAYDREPVLENVSLTIPKGGLTVITGASGIGKSTLLKLLLGLYRPDGGALSLETAQGSVPLTRSVRALFSYAPQGNFLLSGTLRENLTLTKPDATEGEIRMALHVSAMEEYVASLPQGLETMLRENGAGLSEGQAQRLSLARAVISGAPILLLDEVTSALDTATEQVVLERICALPDRTCIAVTHRPAALELAQCIIEVALGTVTLRRGRSAEKK